jgi:hypothetical protein
MLSLLGNGLFRGSMRCVCEDVGVALAELAGDCDDAAEGAEGDAVPDLSEEESFFLDDDDFVGSLALESCMVELALSSDDDGR